MRSPKAAPAGWNCWPWSAAWKHSTNPSRVTLLTRSRYVRRGIRRELNQWRERRWRWERFGKLVPIRDHDLWQRVDRALQFHQVECCAWSDDATRRPAATVARSDRQARRSSRTIAAASRPCWAAAPRRFDTNFGHLAAGVYPGRITAHNRPRDRRPQRMGNARYPALRRYAPCKRKFHCRPSAR